MIVGQRLQTNPFSFFSQTTEVNDQVSSRTNCFWEKIKNDIVLIVDSRNSVVQHISGAYSSSLIETLCPLISNVVILGFLCDHVCMCVCVYKCAVITLLLETFLISLESFFIGCGNNGSLGSNAEISMILFCFV